MRKLTAVVRAITDFVSGEVFEVRAHAGVTMPVISTNGPLPARQVRRLRVALPGRLTEPTSSLILLTPNIHVLRAYLIYTLKKLSLRIIME